MRASNTIGDLAILFAFSLIGLALVSPPPAHAQKSDDGYQIIKPDNEPPDLIMSGASKIIPTLLKIKDLKVENASLHPSLNDGNAEIIYTLPEPGFVTIRVARRGTRELYLATILNLEFRDAGTHSETWDGRDFYGNSLYTMNLPLSYRVQAESLTSGAPPHGYEGLDYVEGQSQEDAINEAKWQRHVHTWHEGKYEHIPLLTINSPATGSKVRGKLTLISSVDRERRGFGDKYGYGVRYYVDNEIIHEEFYTPQSGGRFSYELDTTAFDDGEHTVHVGLCDHNDHVTSHGIVVAFDNLGP